MTTMAKCELNDFPCVDVAYAAFDSTCATELRIPVTAHEILNESAYCTLIPINQATLLEELESNDYLTRLRNKVGLYHLWVDLDSCDDHSRHTMRCIYVGKGFGANRVASHIKTKCADMEVLYVSFFECENRLAKYLEQLFLDTYDFDLNQDENRGQGALYGVWDEDRHMLGTELDVVADIYGRRIGPGPYEV